MFYKSLGLLLLVSFSFLSPSIAKDFKLPSYDELCKQDPMCYLLKDRSGTIKQPHRILMFLLQGYRTTLIQLGEKYNVHPALPAAVIITEHSINVGIEDVIQDSLSQTIFTRNGAFLGLKEMSFGFGQLYTDATIEAENKIAALENRNPDQKTIRERMKSIEGSLEYVTALMSVYAQKYEDAGYDIRSNIGVMSTLYNIGKVDSRIERTKKERRDPGINYFGWFVAKYWDDFNTILSEDSSINLLTTTDTPSAQENNTDYSGTNGKIRWLISSLNSTPVYARLQVKNPIRLFYQPFRCNKNFDLRDNFVNQNTSEPSVISAASISKISFKTEAKGFFQPQAINFDCFANPWVLLNFDTGESGWVDFKSIQSLIEYKYEEVSCNQKQQQQCFSKIKSLIQEDNEFKNYVGNSVILKEDPSWGQIHVQLAPGTNKKTVALQSTFAVQSCEREAKRKTNDPTDKNYTDSYRFILKENETPVDAYKRYKSYISYTATETLTFDQYLQKKISTGAYRELKVLKQPELNTLDSIVEKVFKDKMLSHLNLKPNTESYLILKDYLIGLGLRSLEEQLSWMKSYLDVCYKIQNDTCYHTNPDKLVKHAVQYADSSIWDAFSEGFSYNSSYDRLDEITFYSKSRFYERWENEVLNASAKKSTHKDNLIFIEKYCQPLFNKTPNLSQRYKKILNDTLYTFKDSILYDSIHIEQEDLNTLANTCVLVSAIKQNQSLKTIPHITFPFAPKRFDKTHTFKVKLNRKAKEFPYFSVEQIFQLPLNAVQVESIVDAQLDYLQSSYVQQIDSRKRFLEKYFSDKVKDANGDSYYGSLCTYSLTSTFKRLQALSQLECVETIYIPEEDSLLPAGIQYNLPITVFPIPEKDRFIVQAKKACQSY